MMPIQRVAQFGAAMLSFRAYGADGCHSNLITLASECQREWWWRLAELWHWFCTTDELRDAAHQSALKTMYHDASETLHKNTVQHLAFKTL